MKLMTLFVNIIEGSVTYTAVALFYKFRKELGMDPLIGFVLFILLLVGIFILLLLVDIFILVNELFQMPWKEQTTVTDQITVSKKSEKYFDDKYFVKRNDKEVKITEYEEVEKTDDSRYQLKTTKYYGILGTDVREENTLIVPVDTKIIQ